MASATVHKDRIIQTFSLPYSQQETVYKKINFDERVKQYCSEKKNTASPKVCKVVVVGEVGVGKTCLVTRFCHDTFDTNYKATIGVDFEVEKLQILGIPFNLQMWDTAGQERFQCIAESYYRSAQVVIVTFELGNTKSLDRCNFWKESACKCTDNPLIFLVGAKKDLMDERIYKDREQDALRKAKEIGAEYWPTSAKSGLNVKDFFFRVACLSFDKITREELESGGSSAQTNKAASGFTMKRNEQNLYEKTKKKTCC